MSVEVNLYILLLVIACMTLFFVHRSKFLAADLMWKIYI